jgi:hypothetical protein
MMPSAFEKGNACMWLRSVPERMRLSSIVAKKGARLRKSESEMLFVGRRNARGLPARLGGAQPKIAVASN